MFVERARSEATMLVDTPGGVDLVRMVAFIYTQEGTQFRGGLEGIASEVSEKAHYTYEGTGILTQAFGVMRAAQKLQPDQAAEPGTVASREAMNEQLERMSPEELAKVQQEVMAQGLDTLWRLGKLLLEERLRTVCEMALEDAHKECPHWYERAGEFLTTGGLSTVKINELADALCLLGETFYEVVNKKTEDEEDDADHSGFAQLKEAAGVTKPKTSPSKTNAPAKSSATATQGEGCPPGFAAAPGFAGSGAPPTSYPKKTEKVSTPERLGELPIRALRGVLREHGVSYAHCVEKAEIVTLVVESLGLPIEIEIE